MKISGFRLKLTALILGVLMACSFCFGFAACGGNNETAKYTVTFDANGGHLTGESSVTVEKGSLITLVPVASKDGAVFEGWFTAATDGDKINLETYKVNADVKFYAHYLEALTVTFDANGGVLTGKTSATVGKGGGVATEDVPFVTKQGSGFYGWFTAKTGGERVEPNTHAFNANTTLYAQFGAVDNMALKNLKNSAGQAAGYRIEAEDAKIEGKLSSNDGKVTSFVEQNIPTASGNKSVGYLAVVGNKVTFTFNSAAAGKASVTLRASSNNTQFDMSTFVMWVEDQTVTSDDFTVTLNDEAVDFENATLRGAGKDMPNVWNAYFDPISLGELDVRAGYNVLVVTVASITVPNLDCIDLETSLKITSADGTAASGNALLPEPPAPASVYEGNVSVDLIVGGYEGGPAIEKAVLNFKDHEISKQALANLAVTVGGRALGGNEDKMYLADASGNALAQSATSSHYAAVEYKVSFEMWGYGGNLSPFTYDLTTNRNNWKDLSAVGVKVNGTLNIGGKDYTKVGNNVTLGERKIPCLDDWKLDGTFTDNITFNGNPRTINLMYGSYEPAALKNDGGKNPLIIWLHGAGEGGADPTITLLGNQVSNLSKDTVQKYFKTASSAGAYVLAPQTPTMWMDEGDGKQASSPAQSVYTESLFKLITEYVSANNDIDANRIYVGGCSNGGWMTLELLKKHGEYFAAAYPVAAPYGSNYIDEAMINKLKNIPIWFTHSKDDPTVKISGESGMLNQNTNELYIKLLAAGATNVYYSLFETVTVGTVKFNGHYSWIYTLLDQCVNVQAKGTGGVFNLSDFDIGSTQKVQVGGKDATLWSWLAAQSKTA